MSKISNRRHVHWWISIDYALFNGMVSTGKMLILCSERSSTDQRARRIEAMVSKGISTDLDQHRLCSIQWNGIHGKNAYTMFWTQLYGPKSETYWSHGFQGDINWSRSRKNRWIRLEIDHVGSDHVGSGWIRLDHVGSGWITLDQVGSRWIRLDHVGSGWIILDHLRSP